LSLSLSVSCTGETAPELDGTRSWTYSAEPSLVIGDDETREGHQLYSVVGATRLSDGRIAIANGGTSEIRFFSTDGEFLGSAGRDGRGPEEFRLVRTIAPAHGDTIAVLTGDPAIAFVSPQQRVIRKRRLDVSHIRGFHCRIAGTGSFIVTSDGSLVVQAEDNRGIAGCPPMAEGRSRNTDLVFRVDSAGVRDTVAILPGTEREGPSYAAFGRMLAVAATDDRIYIGDTGADSIIVFSSAGIRIATWHIPLEAQPISPRVRDYQPEPFESRDGTMITPEPLEVDTHYPVFGRLLVDRVGHLWVMAYPLFDQPVSSSHLKSTVSPLVDANGAEWIVLDPEGVYVASVRTPPGLYVLEAGSDYVLGLARDERDVETVHLHFVR
jgi:hypothetical protein